MKKKKKPLEPSRRRAEVATDKHAPLGSKKSIEKKKKKKNKKEKGDKLQLPVQITPAKRDYSDCIPPPGAIWNPLVSNEEQLAAHAVDPRDSPSPAVEVRRQALTRSLQETLQEACRTALRIKYNNVYFENWLLCNSASPGVDAADVDPIIPSAREPPPGMVEQLVDAGAPEEPARRTCSQLSQAGARAVQELRDMARRASGAATATSRAPAGKRVHVAHVEVTGKKARVARLERKDCKLSAVDLTFDKVSVRINEDHYDKLAALFKRFADPAVRDDPEALHAHVFTLLVRYNTLQGGSFQGGGMQAACPEAVFDSLLLHFEVELECFASPLNCRYSPHCSMFRDTDAPFGSIGSFFRFRPHRGSFQANPPFEVEVMKRMNDHMCELLAGTDLPLSFAVIVPAWRKSASWHLLKTNRFCTHHLLLSQRDHGFCEGSQHSRPTRYRISTCDTSIFFLQNTAGHAKWPASDEACEHLTAAFASKHVTVAEMMAAKQQARGGE